MPLLIFIPSIIYFLPGFIISRVFEGKLKNNPLLFILLSLVFVPLSCLTVSYIVPLKTAKSIAASIFFSSLIFILFAKIFIAKKIRLPKLKLSKKSLLLLTLYSFLFALISILPRLNLWNFQKFNKNLGDEFKHLNIITSVATTGFPIRNYAAPKYPLVYYWFNHSLPGITVALTSNAIKVHQAWLIHNFITNMLACYVVFFIGLTILRKNGYAFLFLLAVTILGGFDFLFFKYFPTLGHLDKWGDYFPFSNFSNIEISNPLTVYFWEPQHMIATILLYLWITINFFTNSSSSLKKISSFLLLGTIIGFSGFVFLTAGASVFLIFVYLLLFKKKVLKRNLLNCLPALPSAALILSNFIGKSSLRFEWRAQYFYFLPKQLKLPNLTLSIFPYLLVEFGPLFLLACAYIIKKCCRRTIFRERENWRLIFALTPLSILPLIFIIASYNCNDFGMRSTIPAFFAVSLIGISFLSHMKKTALKKLVISLMFITIISSAAELKFLLSNFSSIDQALVNLDDKLPLKTVIFHPHLYQKTTSEEFVPQHSFAYSSLVHRPFVALKKEFLWNLETQYISPKNLQKIPEEFLETKVEVEKNKNDYRGLFTHLAIMNDDLSFELIEL